MDKYQKYNERKKLRESLKELLNDNGEKQKEFFKELSEFQFKLDKNPEDK